MPNPPLTSRTPHGRIPGPEPEEARHIETVLAVARAVLAVGCLAAVYLGPAGGPSYTALAYNFLLLYGIYSVLLAGCLALRIPLPAASPLAIHAADLLWAGAITVFTGGAESPFFVLFVLVILAAAYRGGQMWGWTGPLATSSAAAAILVFQKLVLAGETGDALGGVANAGSWNAVLVRGGLLMLLAAFAGYFAERDQARRFEAERTIRLLVQIHSEFGLRRAMHALLAENVDLFQPQRVALVVRETRTERAFLWHLHQPGRSYDSAVRPLEIHESEHREYLFEIPAHTWHVWRKDGGAFNFLALDAEGRRLDRAEWDFPAGFQERYPFQSLLGVALDFEGEWTGRLYLFDPRRDWDRLRQARFLQRLTLAISPALYNVYQLRRLRSHAASVERARVARELHDGPVQALLALEMRLEFLRIQAERGDLPGAGDLAALRDALRREILNLREQMEKLRPWEMEPRDLPKYLSALGERFQLETGIQVRVASQLDSSFPARRTCREFARIVQEALANVRKHSGAKNVCIELSHSEELWKLAIRDDGRGFPFAGRFHQQDFDAARRGPQTIMERVRALGGELELESRPGEGTWLEITMRRLGAG